MPRRIGTPNVKLRYLAELEVAPENATILSSSFEAKRVSRSGDISYEDVEVRTRIDDNLAFILFTADQAFIGDTEGTRGFGEPDIPRPYIVFGESFRMPLINEARHRANHLAAIYDAFADHSNQYGKGHTYIYRKIADVFRVITKQKDSKSMYHKMEEEFRAMAGFPTPDKEVHHR